MASIAPPSHTRSKKITDDWITPQWLIKALPEFDLDVCASRTQPWPCAKQSYTEKENGLLVPWTGFVWCNPPYGRRAAVWLNKMALHNNGIALVFARTDTRMFFDNVWSPAALLLFIEGRITFNRPDGSAPPKGHNSGGPSVLIAYGERAAREFLTLQHLGALVLPYERRRL